MILLSTNLGREILSAVHARFIPRLLALGLVRTLTFYGLNRDPFLFFYAVVCNLTQLFYSLAHIFVK